MKIEDVKKSSKGVSIKGKYLLRGIDQKKKRRSGEPFIVLHFQDSTGRLEGRVWDSSSVPVEKGEVVAIVGEVDKHHGESQIKVRDMQTSKKQNVQKYYLSDGSSTLQKSPKEYYSRVIQKVKDHCSNRIQSVLGHFLGYSFEKGKILDEKTMEKVCSWPAARKNHHSDRGGLIHHIYSMSCLAEGISSHYNNLYGEDVYSLEKTLAGVVLHDLGKIQEMKTPLDPSHSKKGESEGHISIMTEELLKYKMSNGMDESLYRELRHMILSHHGKKEWGSPVEPKTPEARLLHRIDMMDSRSAKVCEGYTQSDEDEDDFYADGKVYKSL